MNKRFITLLLIFIAAVVLIGVLVSGHNSAPKNGTVDINFQLPSTQGLGALVNNNNLKITGLQNSYTMTPGHKEMVVIKPGYTNRTIDFTVVAGQTIIIEVTMQTNAPKTQSTATSQIASDWTGFLPSGYTVQQAVYFYSNSWVVATVNAEGGDTAVIVAQYVGGSTPWQVVLGPGTVFLSSDLNNLPPDVVAYMNQQDYVL